MAGMPRKTWQHGTATGYRHHWCRCDDCTAANSAARLRLLAANRKLVAAMETRQRRLIELDILTWESFPQWPH